MIKCKKNVLFKYLNYSISCSLCADNDSSSSDYSSTATQQHCDAAAVPTHANMDDTVLAIHLGDGRYEIYFEVESDGFVYLEPKTVCVVAPPAPPPPQHEVSPREADQRSMMYPPASRAPSGVLAQTPPPPPPPPPSSNLSLSRPDPLAVARKKRAARQARGESVCPKRSHVASPAAFMEELRRRLPERRKAVCPREASTIKGSTKDSTVWE